MSSCQYPAQIISRSAISDETDTKQTPVLSQIPLNATLVLLLRFGTAVAVQDCRSRRKQDCINGISEAALWRRATRLFLRFFFYFCKESIEERDHESVYL